MLIFILTISSLATTEGIKSRGLTNFVNNWDGHLKYTCPRGHYISHMYSEHNNHHEDRRFKFDCRAGDVTTSCSWTGTLNGYDHTVNYNCPNFGVISGFESWHNSHHEDRQWKFWCCKPNINPTEIRETGWINDYDAVMNFRVDNGWFIHGAFSEHNSRREDRQWKLRLAKIKQPVTCTITRIEADKIQATYLGPKVVASQSKEICRPGQRSKISITHIQSATETTSVSKSRATSTSFNFGVTVGVKSTVGLDKGTGVTASVEKSVQFSTNIGTSSTNTIQNSKSHTVSQTVMQSSDEELLGPQGVLLVALLDEYKYDKQDVGVTLHLTCSDGTNPRRRDKMHIRGHTFNHFHVEPIFSRSDLTEGQCNAQPSECIRHVVRTGDILTNLDGIKKKFALCYENTGSGGKVITTSNYPLSYNSGEDKQWPIVAGVGQLISFEFTDFSIEANSVCKWDWVQVIDGNGQELLKKSCGDLKPKSFISKTNKATVRFHSDGSITRKGFRLEYVFKGDSTKPSGSGGDSTKPSGSEVIMMVESYSEIYNPVSKKTCLLPKSPKNLPYAHGRTFDPPLVCGGYTTESSCYKWNSASGTWDKSHTLHEPRRYHLSWTPASGEGTYLMGGGYGTGRTTEIVKLDGTVKRGFNLKYGISHSCGISIRGTDGNDQLIVTGGYATNRVSLYDLNGWKKNLQPLPESVGLSPGCTSFLDLTNRKRTLIVSGRTNTFISNDIDAGWTLVQKFPFYRIDLKLISFQNRVFLLGGKGRTIDNPAIHLLKDVLEFDVLKRKWKQIGRTKKGHITHHVALVNFDDYKKFCD